MDTLEYVMEIKDQHTIQGKWVDCKRAVPAGQIVKDITEKKVVSVTPSPSQITP
jgi:hypothetical protein